MKKRLLVCIQELTPLCKRILCNTLSVLLLSTLCFPSQTRADDGLLEYMNISDRIISGQVKDADGNPIQGVTVSVKGDGQVVTDEEGNFTITVSENNVSLMLTHTSFKPKEVEVPAGQSGVVNITLELQQSALSEVVVIGYGTKDKRSLTSSVTTIQNKDIKDLKVSSVEQLMIGQAPGVQVLQTTGHPGAGLTVRVRGTGSINAQNEPLYVIDGMPVEAPVYNSRSNPMSFLNPSDIENITILKDAASTSIYGSRGANGVVLITTKTGKKGSIAFDVNAYYGVQQIPRKGRMKMMNAEEFAQFRIERLEDAAKLNGEVLDPGMIPEGYRNVTGKGTDWFDFVTRDYAPSQQYNITMRAGSEKMRIMTSGDFYSVDGIIRNTDYKRASMRVNVDVDISKRLRLGARLNPSYSFRNLGGSLEGTPNEGPLIGFAYAASPIESPYLPDGSVDPVISSAPENWIFASPVNRFAGIVDKQNNFNLLASTFLELDLYKGLMFKTNVGLNMDMLSGRYWRPWWVGGRLATSPGGSLLQEPGMSEANASRSELINWLIENYITYNTTLSGGHDIEVLLGQTAQRQEYDIVSASATRFSDDRIPYVSAGLQGDFRTGSSGSDASRYAISSYFARVNYSYKNRYYLNATLRRDGSSRFSPNARYGDFPSVSVGWRLSDESFMEPLAFLDDLKIRGSYGITGNNNFTSSFAYVSGLQKSNYILGNQLAAGNYISYVDQNLRWEQNKELDIGLDVSVFNRRLSLTIDYYDRLTYNLLLNRPVPTITGVGQLLTNVGKMLNKGWEIGINSQNIVKKAFRWETSFNISFNKNKVLELNDSQDPIESGNIWWGGTTTEVGKPIALYKGWIIDGIYRDEAEATADLHNNPGAHAGTLKMRDINGDHQITGDDRTIIGNPHPKFIFGLRNSVQYKNLDLNISVSGSVGNDVMLSYYETIRNMDGVFNVLADVKNRWRSPEQPGNGIYPTTNYPDQLQYIRMGSNMWVRDGSYARIDNITLGYTFRERLLNRSRVLKSCRLYFSVQNALIISKIPLNNPDASLNGNVLMIGWQKQNYPLPRILTLGINTTF